VENFVTVLWQIHSHIFAPEVINIEHGLTELLRKQKGCSFCPTGYIV